MLVTGDCPDKFFFEFLTAIDPARFLFGPEVQAYVMGLREDVVAFQEHCKTSARAKGEELEKALDARGRRFAKLKAVYDDFPKLIAPYVDMHHRLP
jgi:hypothetical protein